MTITVSKAMNCVFSCLVTALAYSSTVLAQAGAPPATPPSEPPPETTGLQSGGLAPPPAVTSPRSEDVAVAQTEQELATADREDSGRGLEFFWLQGELGAEHLGLETLHANRLIDASVVSTTGTGLVYGAGIGVRLLVLTLGARFRMANFSSWRVWTLNGELGLHIPIGSIEPYFTLGGGYASLGSFDNPVLSAAGLNANGFNLRGGVGIDYYLSNTFSVGANLTGDVLFLGRSALSSNSGTTNNDSPIYAQDGSSVGAGGTLTAVVGFHL